MTAFTPPQSTPPPTPHASTALEESQALTPTDAARGALRERLLRHGTVLVHGTTDDWSSPERDGPRLHALLGRDRDRYDRLADPAARRTYAASRHLLKYAAGAALDAPTEDVELGYEPAGRPAVRGCDALGLSLSHTGNLLLVGLTTRGPIGVDLERADRAPHTKGLAEHLCVPAELRDLAALPEEERDAALLRLWTLKEAYTKAIGQGLRFAFTEFGFTPPGAAPRLRRPDGTPAAGEEWQFGTFGLTVDGAAYRAASAVHHFGLGPGTDTGIGPLLDAEVVDVVTRALNAAADRP